VTTHSLLSTIFLVVLCACAAPPKVAVEERAVLTNRQEVEKFGGELIRFAQPGDSLHGIAFVYGLNVKRLAAWNELGETDRLLIGQRIRLTEPIGFRMPEVTPRPRAEAKPNASASNKPNANTAKQTPAKRANTPSTSEQSKPRATSSIASAKDWLWPVRGSISQRFQPSRGKQGINIQSQLGEPIRSARAGKVVYSGNSLKGYGHLIIIKHDETYLSAYAYTQDVDVKEGDTVQASQVIARVGSDNFRTPALHFQIRKDGVPIDPLIKLPKS